MASGELDQETLPADVHDLNGHDDQHYSGEKQPTAISSPKNIPAKSWTSPRSTLTQPRPMNGSSHCDTCSKKVALNAFAFLLISSRKKLIAPVSNCRSIHDSIHQYDPGCQSTDLSGQSRTSNAAIKSIIRWNAMANGRACNREDSSVGGHISTLHHRRPCTKSRKNHFIRGRGEDGFSGDQVYYQGHAALACTRVPSSKVA